jgi:hypothetical protein
MSDGMGSVSYNCNNLAQLTSETRIQDGTLDRSYEYDQVGRLAISHTGTEARAALGRDRGHAGWSLLARA